MIQFLSLKTSKTKELAVQTMPTASSERGRGGGGGQRIQVPRAAGGQQDGLVMQHRALV